MQIIIEDNKILRLTQVHEAQEEVLYKYFSAQDLKAFYARRMGRSQWDGWYRKYNKNSQTLRKPFLKELIRLCDKHGFPYDVIDLRDKSKWPRPAEGSFDEHLLDGISLRDNQMRALKSVCKQTIESETGIHWQVTGSGKTEIMAAIVRLFRCPTVIVTEQIVVLQQISERLKLRDVVRDDDIGVFCTGFMPDSKCMVIIGSISALMDPKKPKKSDIKIKDTTMNKEFQRMYDKDREGLVKLLGLKPLSAYKKSIILDNIRKNKKSKSLLGIDKWDDREAINAISVLDKVKRGLVLGDSISDWDKTSIIDNEYERYLQKAVLILDEILRDKFYKAAVKGYQSRCIKANALQSMVGKAELLMVDECDRASADNYKNLFNKWFSGRYIYGFSGTPFNDSKPVHNLLMKERFGPVLSVAKRKEMTEAGAIQPIKYIMIKFGKEDRHDKTAFDIAERKFLIDNDDFHQEVKRIALSFPNDGNLIIVDTSNIEDLGKSLEEKIPGSIFIHGKTSVSKRNEALRAFENREITNLIGSKILKRGLDLKGGAENMIMIGGGKDQSNLDQTIGRAVRKTKRGWARVFAFYITCNSYLLTHSRRQLKGVVEMGYDTTVIYDGIQVPGDAFIKSRYRIPKIK